MKRIIRLNENMLHNVVREAVSRILSEVYVDRFTPYTEEEAKANKNAIYAEDPYRANPSYGILMLRKYGWSEEAIEDYLGKDNYELYKNTKI